MRALLYADWEELHMIDTPVLEPGPGEVRIKVEAAGICGSELDAVRKHSPRRLPPLILGHEFTGVVEALGPGVEGWSTGEPVVANAVIADGTCLPCRRGQSHLCANRTLFGMQRPGAFAEFVSVPAHVLIPRPSHVSPAAAAMTEPLANGVHIAGLLAHIEPDRILVFGAGPIGLLAVQALKIRFGSKIAVVDKAESRLEVALKLGADATFVPGQQTEILAWSEGDGYPATVDAVGANATKDAAIKFLRPGGTAIWIGLHDNESSLNAYDLILPEKTVRGSYASTQDDMAVALDWIATGQVDAATWTQHYPLTEADVAFKTMLNPGPNDVKGVITMI